MSILGKRKTGGPFRSHIDMLGGNLLSGMLLFAVPMILTNLLQTFYNAADTIIVGLSGVEGAIGAIGTTNSFCHLLVNFFTGFSVGSGVVVARNIGAGQERDCRESVHTSLLVAVAAGLLTMVIGLVSAPYVLAFMGDQGHVLELATLYTRVYFLAMPFLALTNFEAAILRAKGDTVTPMVVLALAGVMNVILNLVFVLLFHRSVDGVAAATVISNVFSSTMLLICLLREKETSWIHVSFRELRFSRRAFSDVARNGLPAAAQSMLFSISNMTIQSACTNLNNVLCPGGSDLIDGRAAAQSIESFLYTIINSIAQASVTFTSQNLGARNYRRVRRVMANCYALTIVAALCGISIIHGFRYQLLSLYVSAPFAIETGETFLFTDVGFYVFIACMETASATLRGIGKSLYAMIITLLGTCVLRILWVFSVYPQFGTFASIIASYPVTWFITGTVELVVALRCFQRMTAASQAEQA